VWSLWCCSRRVLCGVVRVVCLCVWPVSLLTHTQQTARGGSHRHETHYHNNNKGGGLGSQEETGVLGLTRGRGPVGPLPVTDRGVCPNPTC